MKIPRQEQQIGGREEADFDKIIYNPSAIPPELNQQMVLSGAYHICAHRKINL